MLRMKPARRPPLDLYQPDFNDSDLDFVAELERLPFPVNLGNVEMMKAQQVRCLQLIYDNQTVFLPV